jgi:hypothetical protein
MRIVTREQLRKKLLHRLTEDETRRLEELLLQDPDVVEMLRREEAELVADYAAGGLGAPEREAFEKHLLIQPTIRERVSVARASQGATVELKPKVPLWDRWPARAVAAFVACLFAVPLLMRANREPTAVSAVMAAKPASRQPADAGSTNIVLVTDLQQSGGARVVRVPAGAVEIHLLAEVTSDDLTIFYGLKVEDESGARIFAAQDLRPIERSGHDFVEVSLPGLKLGTGRRIVLLEPQVPGVESFMWQADVQPAN